MIARLPTTSLEHWRSSALWLCLSLFVVRVIGQIEVVVVSPHWLPPCVHCASHLPSASQ